jgi:hypothetical protein
MSRANLVIRLGKPDDATDTEYVVDDSLWAGIVLPNQVIPSFETCNIARTYELEVDVGLSPGDMKGAISVSLSYQHTAIYYMRYLHFFTSKFSPPN